MLENHFVWKPFFHCLRATEDVARTSGNLNYWLDQASRESLYCWAPRWFLHLSCPVQTPHLSRDLCLKTHSVWPTKPSCQIEKKTDRKRKDALPKSLSPYVLTNHKPLQNSLITFLRQDHINQLCKYLRLMKYQKKFIYWLYQNQIKKGFSILIHYKFNHLLLPLYLAWLLPSFR